MTKAAHIEKLPELLTRREACSLLRVSLPGLDKFLHRPAEPIPCMRIGRRFLISKKDLLEWARRQADQAGLNGKKKATTRRSRK